ncbi:4-oxalomesaconate tautomerase [Nonomuraea thailandensis]|uniref:4-oxalomesaconate tautomerase n=1 Tax=Nonomuraea thailandensis TaxID=1188745 RepID=A0A9X2K5I3_9ACTN|nr:4-oxalomesaconate tautomerase [Nonomuraea thailandensis]MCP2360504.1 4-oxalomesaconate tautomerase [Nonomuraea thailandensis]
MTDDGVRCMLMRGGTSKGAYFLAGDLPDDPAERDDLLLRVLGSPDPRQIDGIGGAHLLTSKVAVVSASADPSADVDYLFLQVAVDEPVVSGRQNCGNLLAGVGPFAVERGLVEPRGDRADVRIRLVNTGGCATASFPAPGGRVDYRGGTAISGVPGTAAAVVLGFEDTAGSATGGLLPTGRVMDVIDGIEVTCVDNGMPVVVAAASDLGVTGYESHQELAEDRALLDRVQSLRLQAGKLMGLGDVRAEPVPKTTLVAPPRDGGALCTRTFIPVRPHAAIGVLGAVSVVTAALLPGGVARRHARLPEGSRFDVEHPTGHLEVEVELDLSTDPPSALRAASVRTARKLFDGTVYPRGGTP